ncbi:uncharacterized protein LOC132759744 [Ruditapes philippinarum]|uniref:uncharacterized protein LOC132759744 n=1 Tax=Ruditapes philippinarum TaxID=129788 RepID=UPI00295AC869|nr:uncharacterized protein LOC132759744 [Ruditapes philippinarum]
MALTVKIMLCLALCMVIVQGRASDPSYLRRELLLRALNKLQEKSEYSDLMKRLPEEETDQAMGDFETDQATGDFETDQTTGDFETDQGQEDFESDLGQEPDISDDEGGVEYFVQRIQDLIQGECGELFASTFYGNTEAGQEDLDIDPELTPEVKRKIARDLEEEPDAVDFIGSLALAAQTAYECMLEGRQEAVGGEEANNVEENDEEATMNDETTTDSLDSESQTEMTTPAPVGSTTPGESETEEGEIAGLVERELLKELLKERISKLSKNGYNGKK